MQPPVAYLQRLVVVVVVVFVLLPLFLLPHLFILLLFLPPFIFNLWPARHDLDFTFHCLVVFAFYDIETRFQNKSKRNETKLDKIRSGRRFTAVYWALAGGEEKKSFPMYRDDFRFRVGGGRPRTCPVVTSICRRSPLSGYPNKLIGPGMSKELQRG